MIQNESLNNTKTEVVIIIENTWSEIKQKKCAGVPYAERKERNFDYKFNFDFFVVQALESSAVFDRL